MSDQQKIKRQLIAELAGLRQRHADLERSLQTSPTPVFITRLSDGLIVEANESAEKLTGYSRNEIIGKTVLELGLYADASVRPQLVARLRDGSGVRDLELRLRAKSGDLRHIVVSACLTEIGGEPGMLSTIFDITPFRRLEAALRESEEKYRNVVERANDGICIIQDMVVKYVNPRLAQMWDGSTEEVVGRPFADFVHPDARLTLIDRYRRRMEGAAVPATYETVLRRKDGTGLFAELNVGLIAYEGTSAELVIVRDISERRRAEESLRLANAYNRSLIEASLDPLVTIGPDGKITDVNKATQDATGYSQQQLVGTDFSDYFTEPERAREAYRQTFREGEVHNYALDLRHRDGPVTSVLYNASVYRDEAGRVVGVFAAARDMTERRRAEAEQERLQAQLLESQKMEAVGQLAGGVAHDFNNLLTVILGGAELVQLGMAPDDQLQDMVTHVRNAAQRAATLVSQLLGFARKQMIFPRVSNLNDIVTVAAGALRKDLDPAIDLIVLPAPNLSPVKVDPQQFTRVIHDLAQNAARAMPDGGKLTIATANVTCAAEDVRARPEIQPGDYALLAVNDTGAAMSPDTVDRVFEPFFIRSREVATGVGLRMASVYGIVKQNHGHIFAESQEGTGTTFKVYLPHCEQADADSSGGVGLTQTAV